MATDPLIANIRGSTIGINQTIWGPFGARRLTYADYSASGRALGFIEDFIRCEVLPYYANTHTEASSTGLQTSRFREEARSIIENEVGAGRDASVVFCGSGATAAVAKMIGILGLRLPEQVGSRIPKSQRPVVFVGPYEHHSNYVSWRETVADVVVIREDKTGHIDVNHLEAKLHKYAKRPLLIGSFSAASNVTGIITDVPLITSILKRHGSLAMFDYAASGSHTKVTLGDADALFLSPHKIIGGVGTPGVLVVRHGLVLNRVPVTPGGGTVRWVSDAVHDYVPSLSEREEGGTPAIVESIRAGLVFQLKAIVGYDVIERREQAMLSRAREAWRRNSRITILGAPAAQRVSIVSFLIRSPGHRDGNVSYGPLANRYLHHNFVVALLNDVFGIQARGGCSCAGPYAHRLLNITPEISEQTRNIITTESFLGVKMGWVRVTLAYFMSEREFKYLVKAVDLIATHGWKLLPQYAFNPYTGLWNHHTPIRPPLSLSSIKYDHQGYMSYESRAQTMTEFNLNGHLSDALAIFSSATSTLDDIASPNGIHNASLSSAFEKLRWFDLPPECLRKDAPPTCDRDSLLSGSSRRSYTSVTPRP